MLRQCATTAITAVHAAPTMFAMAAMLGRLVDQLKMPRLDAYGTKVRGDASMMASTSALENFMRDS